MRAEIASWPDGEYSAEGQLEDDGVVPDRPWKIKGTLVIRGDELIVDFTGSDPQCFGPANQTFGTTASSAYNAVLPHAPERERDSRTTTAATGRSP